MASGNKTLALTPKKSSKRPLSLSNNTKKSKVSKVSKVSYFGGTVTPNKLLGKGESGRVYSIIEDNNYVLKVVPFKTKKVLENLKNEIKIQQQINKIIPEGSPKILKSEVKGRSKGEVIIVMEKIYTLKQGILEIIEDSFQKKLVELIALYVFKGFVHNDIHTDNIAFNSKRNPILIDFGLTVKIPTPVNNIVFNQILISQLYAIIDPCNINNCPNYSKKDLWPNCGWNSKFIGDICKEGGFIIDTIYSLRQNNFSIYNKLQRKH